MSASTERLVEQINLLTEAIATGEASGTDTSILKEDLRRLQQKLLLCSEALTEGKRLLKG